MILTFDTESGVMTEEDGRTIRIRVSISDAVRIFHAMGAATMYDLDSEYAREFNAALSDCREWRAEKQKAGAVGKAIDRT